MICYFAAANTGRGFYSLFPSCFAPEAHRRIYVLKGGPGTGKSTLMRRLAVACEAFGYEVEGYLCSSDTSSLDGIRIPALDVAVVDGTAPHVFEPTYAGAVERLVDLGRGFDCAALADARTAIVRHTNEKREAYRTAYRCLAAAEQMAAEQDAALASAMLREKTEAAVRRLIASMRRASTGPVTRRYVSALGTHGAVRLDTLHRRAERVCAVTDKGGLGYLFMSRLYAALLAAGVTMTVAETPLTHTRIEEIYVEGERLLFTVTDAAHAEKADKIVNTARFFSREGLAACRARARFAAKGVSAMTDGALTALSRAGEEHAHLEEIYTAHMDFSEADRVKNAILSEIFANNM
ncbi:MAG: hypothetical protein IJV98_01020 [Clostridia bacterium]|nr:hypothetical protein [Clostridia bacterium]